MQEKLENIKYFYWIVMAHCKKCWKFSEAKHNSSLLTCYRLIGLNKVIIKKASIFSYSPLIFIFFWKKTLRLYKSVIKTCRTDHDTVNFQEDFDMVHWANCSFSAITCEIAAKEIKVNWFSLLKARRHSKTASINGSLGPYQNMFKIFYTLLGCQFEWPKDKPFLLTHSRHARNFYDP